MKSLLTPSPGQSLWADAPIPTPAPDEVLLRVEAVTTCPRWDINLRHNVPMYGGHAFAFPSPEGRPGHEAAGTIAALGSQVTDFQIGQRVCTWKDVGDDRPGCYSQFVALPASAILPIPDHLELNQVVSLELAMCLGATVLRLKRFDALKNRRVAIMGLGPAGLIAAQMARAEGAAEVIGLDPSPQRREFADPLLDKSLDPATADFPARPAQPEIDCTIDCVGANASVSWAMDHTWDTVALFGVQKEAYAFKPEHYLNLTLMGYPGHSREAAEYALDLISNGQLDLTLLATHELPLSRYSEGIDLLESQTAIKIRFLPWA